MSSSKRPVDNPISAYFSVVAKKAKAVTAAVVQAGSSSSSKPAQKRGMLDQATLLRLPQDVLEAKDEAMQNKCHNGRKNFKTDECGCSLFQGYVPANGYPQTSTTIEKAGEMQHGNPKSDVKFHQMAAALNFMRSHTRQETLQMADTLEAGRKTTYSASHICDTKNCSAVEHVPLESHPDNLSRRRCPPPKVCSCGNLVSPCQHIPKCIRKV